MWEGLKGNRRKNGIFGTLIAIVISSILLYLSFYISFLYLVIPIVILVIFHYTKLWRFSDRAFYGFIAVVIAFLIAMTGISYNIVESPHHSYAAQIVSNTTYDVHFNYTENGGNYYLNFEVPSYKVLPSANISVLDLFTNKTVSSYNASMVKSGENYTYSQNLSKLANRVYVVLFTFRTIGNNSTSNVTLSHSVEFLGPVLLPFYSITILFSERLFVSYLAITFLFYLAFAFFARAITTSRQRRSKRTEELKTEEIGEQKK